MFATYALLKQQLKRILHDKKQQGYDTKGVIKGYKALPDDYEAIYQFGKKLSSLTYRKDWFYEEPECLDEILNQCQLLPTGALADLAQHLPTDIELRVAAAFKASVCGCILGKPVEINPTLSDLKCALLQEEQWPLDSYFSQNTLRHLKDRHPQWHETTRENIHYVAPDDDINYTILGMLVLEQFGEHFTFDQLSQLWLSQLPVAMTYGPERTALTKAAIHYLSEEMPDAAQCREWGRTWNSGEELCGALIRVDAYGYAFAGQPHRAAAAAYRDASFTHTKTGVYASMYVAACIALAPVVASPCEIFQQALKYVPQNSRFYQVVESSIKLIKQADNWQEGYDNVHGKFKAFTHCQIYQEIGTLINALHFANSVEEAICIQVSQGNDTDSFGATCGAIAGMYFKEPIGEHWLAPFNDDLRTGLSGFYERSLQKVAKRLGKLPSLFQPKILS